MKQLDEQVMKKYQPQKPQVTEMKFCVVDHGDPSVGCFSTSYDVTVKVEGDMETDTANDLRECIRDALRNGLDAGFRMTVYTQEEINELEQDYANGRNEMI